MIGRIVGINYRTLEPELLLTLYWVPNPIIGKLHQLKEILSVLLLLVWTKNMLETWACCHH